MSANELLTNGIFEGDTFKANPTQVSYTSVVGGREQVPASTNWTVKDQSVTTDTASLVVADAPDQGPVTVSTIDNINGVPIVETQTVPDKAAATALVAAEQQQTSTVAVAVSTKMSIDAPVSYPSPVYRFPQTTSNDPRRNEQRQMQDVATNSIFAYTMPWANAEYPWSKGRGQGVVVAVIDTGVDGTHPDLAGQVLPGYDLVSGMTGPTAGWADGNSHGTHVAGIIAAKDNNGIGIAGVAPEAKILPIRVLGSDGSGSSGTVAQGVIKAVEAGAHIINMSLGSAQNDVVLQTAVEWAISQGVIVIAAGGNLGMPGYFTSNGWSFPASYAGVIGVGAINTDCGGIGGDHIDVSASGCGVLSTIPKAGYARYSGTSMATPQVVGEAADLLSAGVAPASIEGALEGSTARPISFIKWRCERDSDWTPTNKTYTCYPDGTNEDLTQAVWGSGLVQVADALSAAAGSFTQGVTYPGVSTGATVAARPQRAAPTVLPTVTPWAPAPVPAVQGTRLVSTTPTSAVLTWDPREKADWYGVDIYDVVSGRQLYGVEVDRESRTATVTGVAPMQKLRANVYARLFSGKFTDDTEPFVWTQPAINVTPNPPVLSRLWSNAATVDVSWPDPEPGMSATTAIEVTLVDTGRTEFQSFTRKVPVSTIEINGLTAGKSYDVTLRAENSAGWSYSSPATRFTTSGEPKSNDVTVRPGNRAVNLEWSSDSRTTSYRVRAVPIAAEAGVALPTARSLSAPTNRAELTQLTAGVTYRFDVSLVDHYSRVYPLTSSDNILVQQAAGPSTVRMTAALNGKANVAWDALPGADRYSVQVFDQAGVRVWNTTVSSTQASFTRSTMPATYEVKVAGLIDGAATLATTSEPVRMFWTPTAPSGLKVTNFDRSSLTLSWTPRAQKVGAAPVTTYLVTAWDGITSTEVTVPASQTTSTLTQLRTDVPYSISVQALNDDGKSMASAAVNATPRGLNPIEDVSGVASKAGVLQAQWRGQPNATAYKVEVTPITSGTRAVPTRTTAGTTLKLSGLTPGATYQLRVAGYAYGKWWEFSPFTSVQGAS